MEWPLNLQLSLGHAPGGYAVLRPFCLDHDFRNPDESILFFAETSMRALLFATRDFAGGEKLRALRHAFKDLGLYLADQGVREQHRARMEKEFNELAALNAPPHIIDPVRPVEVDLEWLKRELSDMSDILSLAEDVFHRHEYGVVYALHMSRDDVDYLHRNGCMGIETSTRIPTSKIVGKVIVPVGYKHPGLGSTFEDFERRRISGIMAALSNRAH